MLLHRYLGRQIAANFLVIAPALIGLVVLLQAMRLLPLMAPADIGGDDLVAVLVGLAVPLAALALPASMIISLLLVLTRLASDGELVGFRAAGASLATIGTAPAILSLIVCLISGAMTLWAEPLATGHLQDRMGPLLLRAALGRARDGVIVEPMNGVTIRIARRRGARVEGLFLEDRRRSPPVQLFAARGILTPDATGGRLQLALDEGRMEQRVASGGLLHLSFRRLTMTLPFSTIGDGAGGLLPRALTRTPGQLLADARDPNNGAEAAFILHRRLALAPGALGLCLLAMVVVLRGRRSSPVRATSLGVTLILGYHLTVRGAEDLGRTGALVPAMAGWLPALLWWGVFGAVLLWTGPGRRYGARAWRAR